VLFEPEPGWHLYWRNAGDSGVPPKLQWSSEGAKIEFSEILWPNPQRIYVGHLTNYGYPGSILLPVEVRLRTPGEKTRITVHAKWLACQEECIPGEAHLSTEMRVTSGPAQASRHAALFRSTLASLPVPLWDAQFAILEDRDTITLTIIPLDGRPLPARVTFYPQDRFVIENSAQQLARLIDGNLEIKLKRDPTRKESLTRLRGVLVSEDSWDPTQSLFAVEIDTLQGKERESSPTSTAALTPPFGDDQEAAGPGFLLVLLLAFLGGVLMNVMPCVLPIIAIKILAFTSLAGGSRAKSALHGLAFSFGIIVSFLALAGALIGLRGAGLGVGWGFQLQSPYVVAGLLALFLALGVSFLTELNFGSSAQRLASGVEPPESYWGSFLSGTLTTVIASPCVGPLLGTALGATLTSPAIETLMIFASLGVGMSLPYAILSIWPRLLGMLPRPGNWMQVFKELMAFPLFATVAFLVWVFCGQLGIDEAQRRPLVRLLLGLVIVTMGLWMWSKLLLPRTKFRRRSLALLALATMASGIILGAPRDGEIERATAISTEAGSMLPDQYGLVWEKYSDERLASLMKEKRHIYVDFTAAWCAICQVNKKVVFSSPGVIDYFRKEDVALLKADWTSYDAAITSALQRYGRSGVPLNLVIRPGRPPTILPSLLTPNTVLDAFKGDS
jgi:thiol:disulfide interchange protein DsbD